MKCPEGNWPTRQGVMAPIRHMVGKEVANVRGEALKAHNLPPPSRRATAPNSQEKKRRGTKKLGGEETIGGEENKSFSAKGLP